jgi:hypothetical protein
MHAIKGHELHISAPDRPGHLAEVSGRCRDAGVDILGISAYHRDGTAVMVLHTNNPFKAADVMTGLHVTWQEVIVIDCPAHLGVLHEISATLAAAGINILYCYGSVGQGESAKLIMDTSNNDRAIETLMR